MTDALRTEAPYRPSPRPTFDVPTAITRSRATRHLWGDDESGVVADLIYASTSAIHVLVFTLPPGGCFRHSPEHRTVFGADELLHVLSGTMSLANPETGEVHVVGVGQSITFGRDTWHHAFAEGEAPLRVLELFAPPPAAGTSGAYARTRPYLEESVYAGARSDAVPTLRLVPDQDVVWERDLDVPCGVLVRTPRLHVHRLNIPPGRVARRHRHDGEELLYVTEGTMWVRAWYRDETYVFELGPDDACFVPSGAEHEYRSYAAAPATAIVGIAPLPVA